MKTSRIAHVNRYLWWVWLVLCPVMILFILGFVLQGVLPSYWSSYRLVESSTVLVFRFMLLLMILYIALWALIKFK